MSGGRPRDALREVFTTAVDQASGTDLRARVSKLLDVEEGSIDWATGPGLGVGAAMKLAQREDTANNARDWWAGRMAEELSPIAEKHPGLRWDRIAECLAEESLEHAQRGLSVRLAERTSFARQETAEILETLWKLQEVARTRAGCGPPNAQDDLPSGGAETLLSAVYTLAERARQLESTWSLLAVPRASMREALDACVDEVTQADDAIEVVRAIDRASGCVGALARTEDRLGWHEAGGRVVQTLERRGRGMPPNRTYGIGKRLRGLISGEKAYWALLYDLSCSAMRAVVEGDPEDPNARFLAPKVDVFRQKVMRRPRR